MNEGLLQSHILVSRVLDPSSRLTSRSPRIDQATGDRQANEAAHPAATKARHSKRSLLERPCGYAVRGRGCRFETNPAMPPTWLISEKVCSETLEACPETNEGLQQISEKWLRGVSRSRQARCCLQQMELSSIDCELTWRYRRLWS